jgi:hypothetical protein
MLDALMAELYALEWEDLAHLLADCDHPVQVLASRSLKASFDQKGFWRVDKDKDPELRHTVLSLCAFRDLKRIIEARPGDRVGAIASFCAADNGQGWQLPEHLRLADYDLGRDDRARQPQPVASRFGPRFFEFQLAQSAADSRSECEIHAANLSSGIAVAARAQ